MRLDDFPLRICLTRKERHDRRLALIPRLCAAGIECFEWFQAIEGLREPRGFLSNGKRSVALAKRLILRVAARRKAPHLFFLEDDVVFHAEFAVRLAALDLPEDWGVFYFGCQHVEPPQPVRPGLVRVARALDAHAVVIRAPHYLAARAAMRGPGKGAQGALCSDVLFADLHQRIPTYAAFPNLAWQAVGRSDLARRSYSNYDADGSQKEFRHLLTHL